MKIQNNQQGVITDASQNNQQGVITGQSEINKFLSVQEPVGESVVRFKENFAVPVSPSNPYYPLFFHPELSEFKENIANEVSRLEKLNNLQSSKPALIEMELDPNDRKDLEEAKTSRENSITDANDVYDAAAAEILEISRPNIFKTLYEKENLTAKDIITFYKKETDVFEKHLTIDKPELLSTDYQKKIVDLCNTVKKIAKELRSDLDALYSKYLEYKKSDQAVTDAWDAASSKKSRKERDATFDNFIFKYNQKYENISPKIAPKIWRTISEKYTDYPQYRLYINDFNVSFDVGTHKGFGKYNAEKENINIKILPIFFNELGKSLQLYFNSISKKFLPTIAFSLPVSSTGVISQKWENVIIWKEQKFLKIKDLHTIAYGKDVWTAITNDKRTILTNQDGENWIRNNVGGYMNSVSYGNNMWVAVGKSGTILTSSNGTSWIKRISNTRNYLASVVYGNGIWVAVGDSGIILTSKNGEDWTKNASSTTNALVSIAHGNGLWVAVGYSGIILTSKNGEKWEKQTNPAPTTIYERKNTINSITYGDGMWIAVSGKGFIIKSNDGVSWIQQTSNVKLDLYHIAYGDGLWIAIGANGTIVTSNDGTSWTPKISNVPDIVKAIYVGKMWIAVSRKISFIKDNDNNSIKNFVNELHKLEQKRLVVDEKAADNKALKEAEENKKNAIEEANQQFEERRKEIIQEILKDIKFMSQTTAVVLDERIRGWYRSYQQITDEERRFTGLKDACKYKLDANYEDRFSAVVDMDPTDFATTYNADLEDESIDLESSGYLKEIFQKSTTNEEGKVSQIPKSFSEIENDYARYRDLLYQIRDNKSELLREIRLAGYDLVELKEDVGFGGEDRDKVYGLGYHFAIVKGEPEYDDIDLPKGENILQGIYEKDLLSDILAKDKLSKEIGEKELDDIKGIFNQDSNWQKIIENFKDELETVGIPQELDHKFDIQQKQLVGPDDGTIPPSLTTEKEEEKYLKEARLQIPNDTVLDAKKTAELKLTESFKELKKDFTTHLATVDSIANLSDWKGADLFYRNFKTFYSKLKNIERLLKFEFYYGQGVNIKTKRAITTRVSKSNSGFIGNVVDTAANIYDPTGLVRNIASSVSNWFRQTLNDIQKPISSIKEVLGNFSILPIFGLQGSLGGSIALPLPIQGKLINNESPSNLKAQGSLNAINIPVSEMGFSAGTMTATTPSLPKNIGIVAVAFIGNAVGSAIGFVGNVVSGLLGGGGGRGSRRQYIRKNITTNQTLSEPFWYIRIAGNVPDEVRDAWEARGFGYDFISSIKKGNTFVVKLGGWFGKDDSRAESSSSASRAKAVFSNFLNGCSALCDEMAKWHQKKKDAIENEGEVFDGKRDSYEKSLKYLKDYALTKARLKFLLHWKSPGRFGGYKKISNAILPDTDPWVEFANQLKPKQKYNPLNRKVKLDHFRFFKNAYQTQDGLNMHAYLQLIAGDDRSKAMRVAIFPVLDSKGDEIPYLRRAVINPERSFESNPIKTLPKVRFIEQNKISVIWDGICLGELSHTENLMPGENKTITIEKQTRLKEKLSTSFESEVVSEVRDTVSFEEKLSQEVNNEETSENEIMREAEDKQEKSNTQKETILDEHQDTRTDTSSTSGEIGGSYMGVSGNVKHSKDITKTSNQLNRNTQENENAVKDSKRLTQKEMSKEGKKSQQKNLSETINKTATETSNTNKTSIKKTSEQESESMDKRLETIEISNQNVGKTLNYYFFQLQNVYQTVTETENVKIVVDPGHEIIAKSKISDVRVFDINNIASIYEELNCAGNKKQTLLATIILFYVFENYYNSSNVDSEEGRQGLTIDYRGELFNQNDKTIDKLIENKELQSEVQAFFNKIKESSVNFNPIITDSQSDIAVNSGGLYLDVEVGKKMATEPYLENRRDIETHLQNTKVKQLEAEVKHLEAQTQAGIFFPPPQNTPVQISPTANNKAAATFSSFPQDTTSTTSANRESSGNNKKDQSNSSSSESAGDSADEEEADRKSITTDKSDDKLESDNKSSHQIASVPSKPPQKPKKKSWLARLWQKITGSS